MGQPAQQNLPAIGAVAATYLDSQKQINKAVNRYLRRYGGDREEILSRSNELFIDAFNSYPGPEKMEWDRWIYCRVHFKLREDLRKEMTRRNRLARVSINLSLLKSQSQEPFYMGDFLQSLSEDGQILVGLVFDTPIDINFHMKLKGGYSPKNMRTALRQFLQDAGWSIKRYYSAVQEIKEALR